MRDDRSFDKKKKGGSRLLSADGMKNFCLFFFFIYILPAYYETRVS